MGSQSIPLPSAPDQAQRYRPSNGTEGVSFMEFFCGRCERDAKYRGTDDGADSCPIASASMIYGIDEPGYPTEWIYGPDGRPTCTAFAPEVPPEVRAAREERAAAIAAGQQDLFETIEPCGDTRNVTVAP